MTASENWAGVAGNNAEEWKKVENKKPARTPAPVLIKGSRSPADVGEKLRTVPRKPVLAAYVGRLHPDTTPDELTEFLEGVVIKGVYCRKLKAKDGMKFKTSAFFVTCYPESSALFYDENCWPDGVELRDWVYYQK